MEIIVKSRSKNRQEFIKNAAMFYSDQLGLNKSKYQLVIHSLPNLKKEGSNGLCAKTGHRQVTVALYNKLSVIKLLYTLAHEMVHVKQFALGHYRQEVKKGSVQHFWMGKRVSAEYIKRPWEIEAFSRESLLVEVLSNHVARKLKKHKNMLDNKSVIT